MTTLHAGHATNVGQIRSNNEDSFLVAREQDLYAVADGMGGHQGGEVASNMAVRLAEENATEPNLEMLEDAVRQANRAIFEQAGSNPSLHGMGTTFVAVQLVDTPEEEVPVIGWVNVGDSRLYLFRDDEVVQLSHDHSLVEDLVRDGRLSAEEAEVHPQRNILTRALGIDIDVNLDSGTVLPFTGDRFLLCSDGLSNEVTSDQMAAVLRRLADPEEAADELVRQANEHGGRDNITVVIVDVQDDGGRAQIASAILAEQAAAKAATAGADDTTSMPLAEGDGVYDDSPAFAGRRSSLPDSDDDYASETEDPFSSLSKLRTRRITWGVVGFFVLLALIGAAVVGAVGWTARNTYYVTFNDADQVVVYQGKPGGVLFFDPELSETSSVQRDDLPVKYQEVVAADKEFGSKAAAMRYVANLRSIISDREAAQSNSTTTTTTTPATTSTVPDDAATTTTAPVTTTTAGP